jgi:hypothetical protein
MESMDKQSTIKTNCYGLQHKIQEKKLTTTEPQHLKLHQFLLTRKICLMVQSRIYKEQLEMQP